MTFYDGGSVEDISTEYQVRYTNDRSETPQDFDTKTVSSIPWTVQDYKSSHAHEKSVSAAVVVEPSSDVTIPVDGAANGSEPAPYKLGYFGIFRVAKTSHKVLNVIGLVAACAAGTAQPLMSIFFGNLTTAFLRYANAVNGPPFLLAIAKAELVHQVNNDALALLYLAIGVFITTYIYMAAWAYTGDKIATRIRVAYLRAILRQEVSYFDNLGDGEIASRGRSGVQTIQNGISEKVPMCLSYVSTFVTAFIVAYLRCWKLALVMTVIIPCIMVTVGILNAVVKKFHMEEHKHLNKGANLAEESFATVRTVQAFGMEKKLLAAYAAINAETLTETLRSSYAHGFGVGSLSFILYSGYALAFYFAAKLIASGEVPAGNVTSTIFSLFIGAFSIGNIAPNLQSFSAATASAAKIYETIDRTPIIDSASTEGDRLSSCEGSIQLRNVNFSYASRKGNPVLCDLNLDLEPGKMTALVGASGCGKSTIVSLVERFYDPVEGSVYLDGHDLKSLNLQWLRSQIGYVGQEPTLFAATVRENIEFGLAHTHLADLGDYERFKLVTAAAKLANAHDFIMKLPNGYDTHVGERGKLLSGGQKQRVAIARAVVKQPKILLLDEATSALDAKSEGVVQEGLDNASVGRTTIVVAHRLCTIVKADRINVMGPGGVTIESGTHQELLRLKGAYWGLLRTQNNETAEETKRKTMMLKPDHVLDLEKSLKRLSARNFRISMLSPFGDQAALDELAAIGEREDREEEEAHHSDDATHRVKIKPESHSLYYLLTRLFKLSDGPLWQSYVPGVLCAIASGAVYPVYSIVFGLAMTNFARCTGTANAGEACPEPYNSLMRHRANTIALGFFIIALGATVTATIQTTALQRGGSRLVTRLRYLLFRTFIHADIAFHDEEGHSSGVLASSLSDKAQKVHALVGISMGTIIQSAATVLIGFAVALSYGWKLALVVIACSPLTLGAGLVRLKVVLLKDQKTQKAYEASSRRVTEAAAAIRTIASLTMEDHCLEAYSAGLKEPARVSRDMALYGSALYALSQCISLCVIALGFWFGARQLMLGAYTSGDFYTILLSVVFGSIQAGNVFSFVPDISNAHAATEESLALLDRRDPIGEARGRGLISTGPVRGSVRLHKTHFRYEGRPDVRVLEGLDLEIKAGTSVALVGESGCGKSTTLQLIQRFYDPLAGMVTIDGHDIRSMDLNVLRSQMAVVSQEPSLYDGTIAWNVALGAAVEDPNTVTMDQIRTACRQANILDFIESLEEGFNTQVGGKGVALSGGQKQRIAIARALVRDPRILLLDEATSALDPTSEHVVKAALQQASKGRTTITIAHKLSTVMDCDLIYFLKEGKVEEAGTHLELIKKNGYYAELSRLQGLSK